MAGNMTELDSMGGDSDSMTSGLEEMAVSQEAQESKVIELVSTGRNVEILTDSLNETNDDEVISKDRKGETQNKSENSEMMQFLMMLNNKIDLGQRDLKSMSSDIKNDVKIINEKLDKTCIELQQQIADTNKTVEFIKQEVAINKNKISEHEVKIQDLEARVDFKMEDINKNLEEQLAKKLGEDFAVELDEREVTIMENVRREVNPKLAEIERRSKEYADVTFVNGINKKQNKLEVQVENLTEKVAGNRELLNQMSDRERGNQLFVDSTILGRMVGREYVKLRLDYNNPMQFIKSLEQEINEKKWMQWNDVAEIINASFGQVGPNYEWWVMVKPEVKDFKTFVTIFKEKFWNENKQSKVRTELFIGRYREEEGMSMSEYFTKKYNVAKNLEPYLSERDLVYQLSKHFTSEICRGRIARQINTVREFTQYLEEMGDDCQINPGVININKYRNHNDDYNRQGYYKGNNTGNRQVNFNDLRGQERHNYAGNRHNFQNYGGNISNDYYKNGKGGNNQNYNRDNDGRWGYRGNYQGNSYNPNYNRGGQNFRQETDKIKTEVSTRPYTQRKSDEAQQGN